MSERPDHTVSLLLGMVFAALALVLLWAVYQQKEIEALNVRLADVEPTQGKPAAARGQRRGSTPRPSTPAPASPDGGAAA